MTIVTHDPALRIASECDAVRRFIAVLKREERALVDDDVSGLPAITAHKDACRIELESYDEGRPERPSEPTSDPLVDAWRELVALAAEARELNRTNGLLLRQRLARTERALSVLTGAARGGMTYGPNGLPAPYQPGRSFLAG
jgi:flagellar biosynthesis protein FlgN